MKGQLKAVTVFGNAHSLQPPSHSLCIAVLAPVGDGFAAGDGVPGLKCPFDGRHGGRMQSVCIEGYHILTAGVYHKFAMHFWGRMDERNLRHFDRQSALRQPIVVQ